LGFLKIRDTVVIDFCDSIEVIVEECEESSVDFIVELGVDVGRGGGSFVTLFLSIFMLVHLY
jgi:hypothetical protein